MITSYQYEQSTTRGLVLADDATGAVECASLLASLGIDAALTLTLEHPIAQILVVDTESRHLPPHQAADLIRHWTAGHPTAAVFKKTDSTLRGNLAAELEALPKPVAYIPAYPKLGRTVKNGHLYVHGTPVHLTDFARDPHHPIRTSAIADHLQSTQFDIYDAETEEDLDRIAQRLTNETIASPAGFITRWAVHHRFQRNEPEKLKPVKEWLVVCGSRHPQSRRQAAAFANTLITPDDDQPGALKQLAEKAQKMSHPGMILMGGDTASAVWQALGITTLTPLPEVLPGVAACQARGMTFVTKAGGFGDDTLVQSVIEKFQ